MAKIDFYGITNDRREEMLIDYWNEINALEKKHDDLWTDEDSDRLNELYDLVNELERIINALAYGD